MILDPTNTTVGDICTEALKECGATGIGVTPLAEDISGAQARLQWMLQQWERKRWLVWHLVTFGIIATGAEEYTFGPGGQINTNSIANYGLQGLNLVSGGNGVGNPYVVNDTLTLVGSPLPPSGGTAVQIQVTAVNAGKITAFNIINPGAVPSPLPTTFSQQSTTGTGQGATFGIPVWQSIYPGITTASGSVRPAKIE